MVVVADRGMVTKANIAQITEAGAGFITALKAPQVKRLAPQGLVQPSLFDQASLAEITARGQPRAAGPALSLG